MAVECSKCHTPVQMGASFCGVCGTPIPVDNQTELPVTVEMHQYRNFDQGRAASRPRQEVSRQDLNAILKDFESGRGARFESAKKVLKEKRPISAIDPLLRIADKVFVKEEVEKAVYEVLAEIGSDHLVDIILKKPYLDDKMKFMAFSVLADEVPPRALEWLGERSGVEESPFDIFALEIIRRIGTADAFLPLAKHASGNFMEEFAPTVGGGFLLNMAVAGAVAAKQSVNRDMATTLITAVFMPIEALVVSPKLVQKGQAMQYRTMVMAELAKKHGLTELGKLYEPRLFNSVGNGDRTSVMACLASTFLQLGKNPPFMSDAINNVIYNRRKRFFGDKVAAAVLTYSLIQYSQEQDSDIFKEPITQALNDKDSIVSQSAASSVLYLNFTPAMDLALRRITARDARFMPALAFCALYHENPQCKSLFDHLGQTGNKEVKYAVNNWRDIIADWKSG
jgi:hypothetical protein